MLSKQTISRGNITAVHLQLLNKKRKTKELDTSKKKKLWNKTNLINLVKAEN